jgi:hypothetical protein
MFRLAFYNSPAKAIGRERESGSMTDKKPQMAIVDDPPAKEIYANTLIGTTFDGGALSVTLGVGRFVPKKTDEAPKQDTLRKDQGPLISGLGTTRDRFKAL